MGGDGLRDLEFLRPKLVRLVVVQHELPDHPAISQQRNEGNGSNPFLRQHRQQNGKRGVLENVRDGDGLRIGSASPPGRMPCHGCPVFVRQTAPGFEPHHIVRVEDQHAGAVGAHGTRQALYRRPINLGGLLGEVDRLRQAGQHLHLFQPALQFISGALLLGDVHGDTEHGCGLAPIVTDDFASRVQEMHAAVRPNHAKFVAMRPCSISSSQNAF